MKRYIFCVYECKCSVITAQDSWADHHEHQEINIEDSEDANDIDDNSKYLK